MLSIKKACLNPLRTNCYFLIKDKKCLIIDPSVDIDGSIDKIIAKIADNQVVGIILTHGHYDHISAVDQLVDLFSVDVYIHENDKSMLYDNRLNAVNMIDPSFVFKSNVQLLNEGEFTLDIFTLKVVLTPGHTAGSCSLFVDDFCLCGDCIFKLSVGRTDLASGSERQLKESINYFKQLKNDYRLLPGHGEETTLSFEKKYNPYFK